MALHTGEPEHRDRDYFGPPVNRVARLLSHRLRRANARLRRPPRTPIGDRLPDGRDARSISAATASRTCSNRSASSSSPRPDLEREFPPIKSLDRQPHNLPAQPTPLVGREEEVARVRELDRADGIRLVTLTGPGGTGKTRLGAPGRGRAGRCLRRTAPGSCRSRRCAIRTSSSPAIAQPLGVRESGHEPLEATLIDYLRDKRLLLVLDNLEHVLAAAPAIGRILAACRNVAILATSRAALRVYGERETPVPPLPLPDPKRLPPLAELAEIPAVELFVERAKAVRPGFDLTEENARPSPGSACGWKGCRSRSSWRRRGCASSPPDRLLERLAGRLDLLTGGASDRDERQQTLRGAIAWSHDLLPPTAADPLPAPGGLRRRRPRWRRSKRSPTRISTLDALDGVEALVTKSLLRQEDGPDGDVRFAMLETIREFAAERLDESGRGGRDSRPAHAAHFLALAETAEPHLTGAGPGRLARPPRNRARQPPRRPRLVRRHWRHGGGAAPGRRRSGASGTSAATSAKAASGLNTPSHTPTAPRRAFAPKPSTVPG